MNVPSGSSDEASAHLLLGEVEQRPDACLHLFPAVLGDQPGQMGRADLDGAELGAKVARLVASGACVREQQVQNVADRSRPSS